MMGIVLSRQAITVAAPRELCFDVVATAGRKLEDVSETEKIVEFKSDYLGRAVTTIERVVLERPDRISYEWLEGPLPEVRESISFREQPDGATELIYDGWFAPGRGVVGWLVGRFKIKRIFDQLVREHLDQARELAERRAARSRVYASHKPTDAARRPGIGHERSGG